MQILPESTKLQIADAFIRRDTLRAAKANAEEERAIATRAETERKRTAEDDQRAAVKERTQYSDWNQNTENPTFFLETSPGDIHYSEEYGAAGLVCQNRNKKLNDKSANQEISKRAVTLQISSALAGIINSNRAKKLMKNAKLHLKNTTSQQRTRKKSERNSKLNSTTSPQSANCRRPQRLLKMHSLKALASRAISSKQNFKP